MSSLHEVSTNHWEGDAISVLSWKLHTLFELVLKYSGIETETELWKLHQGKITYIPPYTHTHTHTVITYQYIERSDVSISISSR